MRSRPSFRSHSIVLIACLLAIPVATGCVGPMTGGLGGLAGCGSCGNAGCGTGCGDAGCGSNDCTGCGELYVDPWINHPPQCPDPCDSCGNFNGQSCGKCRSVFDGVKSFWGYRCGPQSDCDSCDGGSCGPLFPIGDCGSCGGCDSCGDCGSCNDCGTCDCNPPGYLEQDHGCGCETVGGCDNCSGNLRDGRVYSGEIYHGGEVYSSTPTNAPTMAKIYRPRRERKIFQPRGR